MLFRAKATRLTSLFGVLTLIAASAAQALPDKGQAVPSFAAADIAGRQVDLDAMVAQNPDLVILFFFTTHTGEDIAVKLRRLDVLYGGETGPLRIVAIGWKQEEAALKEFAQNLGIAFHVVPDVPQLHAFDPVETLPVTLIVTRQKAVLNILQGGGKAEADLITEIAQAYLQAGQPDKAQAVAQEAIAAGETEAMARDTLGFALTAEGKLDEAEKEFGSIDSKAGLARVALERGEFEKAATIADEAPDHGYAQTIKGEALLRSGRFDEAADVLKASTEQPAADWQKADGHNSLGRAYHEKGDTGAAIGQYREAVAIDPLNVEALSNEGAALRQDGKLEEAATVLEKAGTIRDDALATVMLEQVRQELRAAADVQRGELVRQQIADLHARYDAIKAAGQDKPLDDWTSPPVVLAFLPSAEVQSVVFERAGTDVAIRRELESRLQAHDTVQVVEREVLDKLLQELDLGSSDLANPDTQLQLGKVLSARMLGFVDFGRVGADVMLYLRLVDTETTQLAAQMTRNTKDYGDIRTMVEDLVGEVVAKVVNGRQLKGLIADAADEQALIINLGARHGAKAGDRFEVVDKGQPIEAGGKIIGYREKKLALVEVTEVADQYAVCKLLQKSEGVQLAKEMKVKETAKPS